VPIFKIFVGWRPKKVPKVPAFFGLEGTLPHSNHIFSSIAAPSTGFYLTRLQALLLFNAAPSTAFYLTQLQA